LRVRSRQKKRLPTRPARRSNGEVLATGSIDGDYLLRVGPPLGRADLRHLLCGWEVRPWLLREMERL
jgi:hypothetical protein